MPNSPDRILTSHVGSLPRPEGLIALNHQRESGDLADEAGYQRELTDAVASVVRRQKDIGIDLVNDGEYGHSMGQRYDYGSWWTYVFQRLGGLELVPLSRRAVRPARPGPDGLALASFLERRDFVTFGEAYGDPSSGAALPDTGQNAAAPVCRGPISYTGRDAVQRDIANLKSALEATGLPDGYLNSVAPGSCARFGNEYYASDTELLYACADAMREEYRATRRTSSSTRSSWRTGSSATRKRWAGRTWSPPPTAGSAAGCTRRSPGPSSSRSRREPSWPPSGSGAVDDRFIHQAAI